MKHFQNRRRFTSLRDNHNDWCLAQESWKFKWVVGHISYWSWPKRAQLSERLQILCIPLHNGKYFIASSKYEKIKVTLGSQACENLLTLSFVFLKWSTISDNQRVKCSFENSSNVLWVLDLGWNSVFVWRYEHYFLWKTEGKFKIHFPWEKTSHF